MAAQIPPEVTMAIQQLRDATAAQQLQLTQLEAELGITAVRAQQAAFDTVVAHDADANAHEGRITALEAQAAALPSRFTRAEGLIRTMVGQVVSQVVADSVTELRAEIATLFAPLGTAQAEAGSAKAAVEALQTEFLRQCTKQGALEQQLGHFQAKLGEQGQYLDNLGLNPPGLQARSPSPGAEQELRGQANSLVTALANLEVRVRSLEFQQTSGGSGGHESKGPNLSKLKSSRPKDEGFGGEREFWQEFRKSVVSWASADFPEVETYLTWAEGQTEPVETSKLEAALGPLAVAFHRQLRRELWSFLRPKSEARDTIDHVQVQDGLEAWRLLRCCCNPRTGRAAVVDV